MNEQTHDPSAKDLIKAQINMVQEIIEHEVWYEAERRHERVDPSDSTVKKRVNEIILQCGHELRMQAIAVLSNEH